MLDYFFIEYFVDRDESFYWWKKDVQIPSFSNCLDYILHILSPIFWLKKRGNLLIRGKLLSLVDQHVVPYFDKTVVPLLWYMAIPFWNGSVLVRGVASIEGVNLVEFNYPSASDNFPDKRCDLWWEGHNKRIDLWWEGPYKRGDLWWEGPYYWGDLWWEVPYKSGDLWWKKSDKRGDLWWEGPYKRGTNVREIQKILI